MRAASPTAFTLTEIMAATAILSVMFSIMFGILQQTSRGWQAANRRVEASQVARLALDQIASDLENTVAVCQTNVVVPGRSPVSYAYGFVHSNNAAKSQSFLPAGSIDLTEPNDFIFVVTPYPPSLQLGTGDLCEAGYIPIFVANPQGHSTMRKGRYALLRHLPLQFGAGNSAVTNAQPDVDFLTNGLRWHETPSEVSTTNRLPLIDNCLKFDVVFWYTDSSGVMVRSESWGRPSTTTGTWVGGPADAPSGLPLAADIQLCVVDERAAERIFRARGLQPLRPTEIQALPTNWAAVGSDLRSTLQESVITLQRRVYFKNAGR